MNGQFLADPIALDDNGTKLIMTKTAGYLPCSFILTFNDF